VDENSVRALLERMAEIERPPTRVDIVRARRDGRKKLRWRVVVIAAPVAAVVATISVAAAGVVGLRTSSPGAGDNSPTGRGSGRASLASPTPSVVTGTPSPPRYAGSGRHYLPPGFVHEIFVSSSLNRLVLQAPPSVARWTLSGVSCSFRYTMIKKTPWGGIPGSGAGAGGASCPTLRPGLRPEGVALCAVRLTNRGEPGTFGVWLMTSASGTVTCWPVLTTAWTGSC
jgi:hypothetical protein